MMNWKENTPDCEEQSVVWFLMTENNSGTKIHSRFCFAYGEESVMNSDGSWCSKNGEQTYETTNAKCIEHDIKCNSVTRTHFSQRWWLSYYYSHMIRDGGILFTRSQRGNNGLCVFSWDAKSLCILGSSTSHRKTSEKSHKRGTELLCSVQGGW